MLAKYWGNAAWRVFSFLLVLVAASAVPAAPAAGGVLVAATASYAPTTSSSDVNKVWRKVQGKLQVGFNFMSEEWTMLEDLQQFDIDWSAREITVPIDLNEGYGVASIPEGGYEARPSTPNVEEITLTWILLNKRFTATKTARYIDERNREAMIKRQILYQGKKAVEDIGRQFADYFYGFSTAYLAQCDGGQGGASSHTITLKNGYGSTLVPATSTLQKAFIARKFKVGDWVALVQGGALVSNAIGQVTARSLTTPSITVSWNGSVSITDGDYIVKANSLENTTIAGTDYNRGLVGWLDGLTSVSLHALSSGSVADWSVAHSDTGGGRFTPMKLHKGADEIANYGGGQLNMLLMSQGVKRDAIALQSAALRFEDAYGLEFDADIKSKGRVIKATRRVPPGMVLAGDRRSVKRMTLLPKPSERVAWGDGKELENQSGFVFSMDFPCQIVWLNRKNFAYWTGLTEQ